MRDPSGTRTAFTMPPDLTASENTLHFHRSVNDLHLVSQMQLGCIIINLNQYSHVFKLADVVLISPRTSILSSSFASVLSW